MQHPEMGEVPYEGHQFCIRDYDNGPLTPAPCLGEHNEDVFGRLLGLAPAEVAQLRAEGVI